MKFLVSLLLVSAFVAPIRAAELKKDIEYGRAGGQPLLLDAHVPDGPGPFPVVIMVHGGGWMSGDKSGSNHPGDGADITPLLNLLSSANYTWFSINYRYAPKFHWPADLEDVNTAVRWVKAHAAEYKGDPDRIALMGHSAGGHLVMFAATQPGEAKLVRTVVGFAPVTDLVADSEHRNSVSVALQNLFGIPKEITPEARKILWDASPSAHVHAGMPPILIVQGDHDRSVPIEHTRAFVEKLKSAGVPCELVTRKDVPHSLVQGDTIDTTYRAATLAWLAHELNVATPPDAARAQKP